jgi:hypothetical protein
VIVIIPSTVPTPERARYASAPLRERISAVARSTRLQELVSFDAEAEPGSRLRVWDRIDDDLVEREVSADATV